MKVIASVIDCIEEILNKNEQTIESNMQNFFLYNIHMTFQVGIQHKKQNKKCDKIP